MTDKETYQKILDLYVDGKFRKITYIQALQDINKILKEFFETVPDDEQYEDTKDIRRVLFDTGYASEDFDKRYGKVWGCPTKQSQKLTILGEHIYQNRHLLEE